MQYIPLNMRGRIYDNREEGQKKKGPHFSGVVCIDGKLYRVTGFRNPARYGFKATIDLYLKDEAEAQKEDEKREAEEQAVSARGRARADFSFL